jgi:hypothetical protein
MVLIGDLFVEVFSVVIQHPSSSHDSGVKDMFQLRPLNLGQKYLNLVKKIRWPSELSSCQCILHRTESQKPESAKSGLNGEWSTRTKSFSAKDASEAFER